MHEAPGSEMKALREKHGFTQEALARALGLRRESLSRIETGAVALTLEVLQRFVRVVTLARGVREQLAYAEARGNLPDERLFDQFAASLRIDRAVADEVVLASMMSYEKKRRDALRALPPGLAGPRRPASARGDPQVLT